MCKRMLRLALAVFLVALGALAVPGTAQAWWHRGPAWYGGGYVAPPVYVAPPGYVAPPVYVAPYSPYDAAPAPRYAGPPAARGCYAGPYVCPLAGPAAAGQSCACDTAQGRIWGQTR